MKSQRQHGSRFKADLVSNGGKLAVRATFSASIMICVGISSPAIAGDKFYVLASPTAQQTIRNEQGITQLYDEGRATVVRVVEVEAPNGRIALEIVVLNRGRASINFSPEDVQISTTDGKPLAIIPYEQLALKEAKRQKSQRFWSRLAAAGRAMSAANAGNEQSSGIFTANTSGWVGGTHYTGQTSGIYSYTDHNPAVAAAAQRDAAATNIMEAEALAARQSRDMAAYDVVLRSNTIDPGVAAGGTVQFDVPKELRRAQTPVSLQMTVTVNGEAHRFYGQLQKAGD